MIVTSKTVFDMYDSRRNSYDPHPFSQNIVHYFYSVNPETFLAAIGDSSQG